MSVHRPPAIEGELADVFEASPLPTETKLAHFPLFVSRQDLLPLLVRAELFRRVLNVHGSIVECGVHVGGGLMAWHHLSAIHEPYNGSRRVIGFDTFAGFPPLSDLDLHDDGSPLAFEGALAVDSVDLINDVCELHDRNRALGHHRKHELVAGDAVDTIPRYVDRNAHLLVALLYLDFDLYEPTVAALTHFRPRMPRGAIIAFDQAGIADWPGELAALVDTLGIADLRLQRLPWATTMSFAVL